MKTNIKKLAGVKKFYTRDYAKRLSLLMLLFFIVFGAVSLYVLLNTSS